MTLSRWIKQTRAFVADYHDARIVHICVGDDGYRDLFHLKDYTVSTVGAGVVWLKGK